MIKKTVVCDRCHEAEAKYYTSKEMKVVYCENCILKVMESERNDDCLRCYHCGRGIQSTGHIVRLGRHYCSVECLMERYYGVSSDGVSSAGELNDTQKEFLIANG